MREFYDQAPAATTDPSGDPPMTVRVHPDDDPRSPSARRAIRTDGGESRLYPWRLVTGTPWIGWLTSAAVATWPVTHAVVYCTAFRHALTEQERAQGAVAALAGDDVAGADTNLFR